MHGWLVIDKPVGPGSTRIVSAVKRALREGGYPKVKVGHGGTLDPLASGVLPIALGEATKLSGRMLDADKVYEFTIALGAETDTLDAEGAVVARSDVRPTLAGVEAVLPRFTGEIEQVPPVYSALKVEGRRACDLARSGAEVALKSRQVTVHSLNLLPDEPVGNEQVDRAPRARLQVAGQSAPAQPGSPQPCRGHGGPVHGRGTAGTAVEGAQHLARPPLHHASHGPPPRSGEEQVTLRARVSKGTYIRSLARDIARALETVGHVTMLRRLKAGPFTLEGAISLDKLSELAKARCLEQSLLPLTAGLDDIPALSVTPDQARALRQGRTLIGIAAQPGLHLATASNVPVALVELSEGELRVVRGFNLNEEGV
ncbi:MAG TPA: tRNA pseudouridine(55) synthase TruB [Allosphingosinicella sp.]|nr:tRNA pseudouridine(55) synthase TruB [Allosphingosinicella sp.]